MKSGIKLLLIISIFFFSFFLKFNTNVFAQSYDCAWSGTVCGVLHGCPANCSMPTACSSFTLAAPCHDTQPYGLSCNCYNPSVLDLPSLYSKIQAPGSNPAFHFTDTPGAIISALTTYIFPIVGLVLLIFIIIGGYRYLTSGGNPKAAESARATITMAFIGFAIIFLAYWITQIAGTILGLQKVTNIF